MTHTKQSSGVKKKKQNAFFFFVQDLIRRYFTDRVPKTAAELAYFLLFSFFPFIIFLSMLLAFLNIDEALLVARLQQVLPREIVNLVSSYLVHIESVKNQNILIFGLLFTFNFFMRTVDSLLGAVAKAYHRRRPKGFIKNTVLNLVLTLMLMFSVFVSLVFLILGNSIISYVSEFIDFSKGLLSFWEYGRFILMSVPVLVTLSCFYRAGANNKMKWRYVLPGVFFSLSIWLGASVGFSFYLEHFGNIALVYGSIGTIIVFMTWLYISSISLIIGAEFNYSLYHCKVALGDGKGGRFNVDKNDIG